MTSKETWKKVAERLEPIGFKDNGSEFWGISKDPKNIMVWEHCRSGERIAVVEDEIWISDSSGEKTRITLEGIDSTVELYSVGNASNLDDLAECLNSYRKDHPIFLSNDLTSLPTFGGKEPENTEGIFSWDEDHFLIYVDEYVGWKTIKRK